MEIFIHRDGEQYGPYSEDDVRSHLADGALLASDLAWHEGAVEWKPLYSFSIFVSRVDAEVNTQGIPSRNKRTVPVRSPRLAAAIRVLGFCFIVAAIITMFIGEEIPSWLLGQSNNIPLAVASGVFTHPFGLLACSALCFFFAKALRVPLADDPEIVSRLHHPILFLRSFKRDHTIWEVNFGRRTPLRACLKTPLTLGQTLTD